MHNGSTGFVQQHITNGVLGENHGGEHIDGIHILKPGEAEVGDDIIIGHGGVVDKPMKHDVIVYKLLEHKALGIVSIGEIDAFIMEATGVLLLQLF
jgi:hypothetical protein